MKFLRRLAAQARPSLFMSKKATLLEITCARLICFSNVAILITQVYYCIFERIIAQGQKPEINSRRLFHSYLPGKYHHSAAKYSNYQYIRACIVILILFALRPRQQFFSHVERFSCFLGSISFKVYRKVKHCKLQVKFEFGHHLQNFD